MPSLLPKEQAKHLRALEQNLRVALKGRSGGRFPPASHQAWALTRRRWGYHQRRSLLPHRVHSSPTAPLCKFGSSLSAGVDGSADEALELSSHSRLSDDHKQLPLERAVPQIIASPRLADMAWGSGAQATGAKRISPFHQAFADRAGAIDHAKLSKTPAVVGAAAAALRGLSSPYGTGDSRWVRGESSIAALSSLAENRPCPACDGSLGADVMTLSCFESADQVVLLIEKIWPASILRTFTPQKRLLRSVNFVS